MTTENENKPKEWEFKKIITTYRDGEAYKWQTNISATTLAFMFENGIVKYVPELQRGQKLTPKGEVKDVFSEKHVKDIYNAMLKGKIHGHNITLNFSKDDFGNINFNEKDNIISGVGYLQILDGQHRIRGCKKWVEAYNKNPDSVPNPDLFWYPVNIENLTNKDAGGLFAEYATTPLKISISRSEFLNEFDIANIIARKVMNESALKDKVEINLTSLGKTNPAVVTFAVLTRGIRTNFSADTKEDANIIAEWLIKFFNKLVKIFPEALGGTDFHRRKEFKKVSFANELMTFLAYLRIAKELQGDKEWEKKLERLNNDIKVGNWTGSILSKDNPVWMGKTLKEDKKIIHGSSAESFVVSTLTEYVVGKKEEPKQEPVPKKEEAPTKPEQPKTENKKPEAPKKPETPKQNTPNKK